MAPDHIRPYERDDTLTTLQAQTIIHASIHIFLPPEWHNVNMTDRTYMTVGAMKTNIFDNSLLLQ
jgi:tellurite resistance-related uncharacterized protein